MASVASWIVGWLREHEHGQVVAALLHRREQRESVPFGVQIRDDEEAQGGPAIQELEEVPLPLRGRVHVVLGEEPVQLGGQFLVLRGHEDLRLRPSTRFQRAITPAKPFTERRGG